MEQEGEHKVYSWRTVRATIFSSNSGCGLRLKLHQINLVPIRAFPDAGGEVRGGHLPHNIRLPR